MSHFILDFNFIYLFSLVISFAMAFFLSPYFSHIFFFLIFLFISISPTHSRRSNGCEKTSLVIFILKNYQK